MVAMLASVKFLYRVEPPPANAKPGSIYRLNGMELASRLSFFLWSSIPDEELLAAAQQGKLSEPAGLAQQVRRMLADPRSKTLTTNFAFEWLKIRDMDAMEPDPVVYPSFNAPLRAALRREMEMFVDSVFREDRSVVDFLSANYTFVNERLAMHYGIPNVRGDQFRRVTLSRSQPLRAAGQGRGDDGDGVSQPHFAGAARRLHSGKYHGHAAVSAAAECGGVQGEQGRREA